MNAIPDPIAALLVQMCPEVPSVELLAANQETAEMAIRFEGGREILLSWDGDSGRLVLAAALGTPKDFHVAEANRVALAYNGLWRESGGARVAAVDEQGSLALLFDLPGEGLTTRQLGYTVEQMATVTGQWIGFLEQARDDARELLAAPLSLMLRA